MWRIFEFDWSKNFVLTEKTKWDADPSANPPELEIRVPTDATFEIKETKLYEPVVTLWTQDD